MRFSTSGSTHGLIFLSNVGPKCTSVTARPARQRSSVASAAELPAADDDHVLIVRAVPLAVHVRDVRQRLARHAEQVGRAEVPGRHAHGTRRRAQPLAFHRLGVHDPSALAPLERSRARTGARRARSAARCAR
jgi:hypothetical protein